MRKILLTMLAVAFGVTLTYAESCSKAGATEKKYTAEGNCDYKTQTRTCCDDKQWSDWDADCEKHEGCFNGTTWEKEPDQNTVYTTNTLPEELSFKNYFNQTVRFYEVIYPLEYTRKDCKCEEGKGWKCRIQFKPINYFIGSAYLDSLKIAEDSCKKREGYIASSYSKCPKPDSSTETAVKFGTELAKAFGIGNITYSAGPHYDDVMTDKFNMSSGCKYMFNAAKADLKKDYSGLGTGQYHCDVASNVCNRNAVWNGKAAYASYGLVCTLGTRQVSSFSEK